MRKLNVPFAALAIALMLAGSPALSKSTDDLSGDQLTYTARIAAERETADLKMRDEHWSPLAVTQMILLDSEHVSIGSDPDAGLVLDGPSVVAHHAAVTAQHVADSISYRIRAVDGPMFLDSEGGEQVTELLLEKGGPRLHVGRYILYYHEISTLGSMIRVLDFESPAYTKFEGLDYFPTDPEYRVEATIEPYGEPEPIQIVDTMGYLSDAWVYGTAEFTLRGKPFQFKLVLFTPDPTPDSVFYVMFRDRTSGRETYGAGRYLLPAFVPSGTLTLDFNRSVNPSCAYNGGFACPLPPAGNRFPFSLEAGIKDYPHRPAR